MVDRMKFLQKIFVLLLAVGLLMGCNGTQVKPTATPAPVSPTASPTINTLGTRINHFMQTNYPEFSGIVLAAQKGNVLISQGYGLSDRENGITNTPQTRFAIGSMTKAFTALAIMMLQERGQLTVQDSICEYVSNCPTVWEPITLHHLLTHTSGIHDYTALFSPLNIDLCKKYEQEEVLALFKDLPLDFLPGSQWSYSNSGYFLLGIVIEKVSGESYKTFIEENIFQPLEMTESGYDPNTITGNRAVGYTLNVSQLSMTRTPCWDVSLPFSAGGLYSTVGDLDKWDQALYTEQLVSEDTLNAIFTPSAIANAEYGMGYGYGWMIYQQAGHRLIEHSGGYSGILTHIARYPDDRVTIIVLTNLDTLNPAQISHEMAALVFEGE